LLRVSQDITNSIELPHQFSIARLALPLPSSAHPSTVFSSSALSQELSKFEITSQNANMCSIKLTNYTCSNTYMYMKICAMGSTIPVFDKITLWETTNYIKFLLLNHSQHNEFYKCAISNNQVTEEVGQHSICQSVGMCSEKPDSTTHYHLWNGKEVVIDSKAVTITYL
jgi:hypothetical protein